MRYTEARLAHAAAEMLTDLDKETVNFEDNFDGTRQEPVVLPSKFPNLLVNGVGGDRRRHGHAAAAAQLGEICDAVVALIDNPH